MEANPKTPGVVIDTVELIALQDVLDSLMDPESREQRREAERRRKSEEIGLKIVNVHLGAPPSEEQYAAIAKAAHKIWGFEAYDELFEVIHNHAVVEEYQFVRYLYPTDIHLARFLMSAYIDVSDNELGVQQAEHFTGQLDKKFAESRELNDGRAV